MKDLEWISYRNDWQLMKFQMPLFWNLIIQFLKLFQPQIHQVSICQLNSLCLLFQYLLIR